MHRSGFTEPQCEINTSLSLSPFLSDSEFCSLHSAHTHTRHVVVSIFTLLAINHSNQIMFLAYNECHLEVMVSSSYLFPATSRLTNTATGSGVFSVKLKSHAVKYSETAGAQREATEGPNNTDEMTSDKDKLHLDVSVSITCVNMTALQKLEGVALRRGPFL